MDQHPMPGMSVSRLHETTPLIATGSPVFSSGRASAAAPPQPEAERQLCPTEPEAERQLCPTEPEAERQLCPTEPEAERQLCPTEPEAERQLCPTEPEAERQLCPTSEFASGPARTPTANLASRAGKDAHGSAPPAPDASLSLLPTARHTKHGLLVGRERLMMLRAALPLLTAGRPLTEVARLVGSSPPTLCRLRRQYGHLAEHEMTVEALHSGRVRSGRPSVWEYILGEQKFSDKLFEFYVATIGSSSDSAAGGRRTAKLQTAFTCMADEPECPAGLAKLLRHGRAPRCFELYLRSRLTPEAEARVRGAKHFQLYGLNSRRDQTLRFKDGSRAEIYGGFRWVLDDMSVNQPYWVNVSGQPLFSRQGLFCVDQRSLRWLGHTLVARPREAYRAEDILRFLRELMAIYGKPVQIVIERGVWHSRKIRGWKSAGMAQEDFERPGFSAEDLALLSDGLSALGVKLIYAKQAHDKIIEVCFNHLQDVLAIKARAFVNIGRHAGEFEIAAKRLRQQRAGRDAGDLGFAPMMELSGLIDAAFTTINARTNSKDEIPDEVFALGTAAHPNPELTERDHAVFLPERRDREIKGGLISFEFDGVRHDYRAPWMVELGAGFRVTVKFDPLDWNLGVAVYNRETSTANFRQFAPGEFIGWAMRELPAPLGEATGAERGLVPQPLAHFYGAGAIDRGDDMRRKQTRILATAFSAMPKPGLPAVKRSAARDGHGNTATFGGTAGRVTAQTTLPRPTALVRAAPLPLHIRQQIEAEQNA